MGDILLHEYSVELIVWLAVTVSVHCVNTSFLKTKILPTVGDDIAKIKTVAALMQSSIAPSVLFLLNTEKGYQLMRFTLF